VGPPVYFVVNNTAGQMDFSRPEDQNLICSGIAGCAEDSLTGQVPATRFFCNTYFFPGRSSTGSG
jgi:hypothetical protein